jgi:hypothetical protein
MIKACLDAKDVFISDVSCSRPKVKGVWRFSNFLHCSPNSRELEVTSDNIAKSSKPLKTIIDNGKVLISY